MIEQTIIISLAITLIYVSFWEGMWLGWFRLAVLEPYTPTFFRKPLFDCIICMASIWGTLIYFGYFHRFRFDFTWDNYLMTILCVGGLNTLIAGVIALAHDCEEDRNYVKKRKKPVMNKPK